MFISYCRELYYQLLQATNPPLPKQHRAIVVYFDSDWMEWNYGPHSDTIYTTDSPWYKQLYHTIYMCNVYIEDRKKRPNVNNWRLIIKKYSIQAIEKQQIWLILVVSKKKARIISLFKYFSFKLIGREN